MSKYKDDNCKSLVPFKNHVIDMNLNLPDVPKDSDKGTCTKVRNAWVNFTHIDDEGIVWVDIERVEAILRTTKAIAKRQVGNVDDKDILRYGKKIYIRAYKITNIIDRFIQEEKISRRKEYLKYSEQIYRAIRDCDAAEVIRSKYISNIEEDRKKLKKKRIKEYNIKFDELTGNKLIRKTAEFSHIRSFAIFREISTDIENGLIVNKETHKIITKKGINDEVELYYLCQERNWNTDWYKKYKNYFDLK